MTTNSSVGLKSLVNRVNNLEQVVSSGNSAQSPTTFADQLIQSTTTTLKDDLQTVLDHYEQGLTALGVDITNITLFDLVKIIPYTVTYVEQNASVIAGILKKDLSSSFKLNTALTFIKQYFSKEEGFIVAYLNQMVDLIFNQGKSTTTQVAPNSKGKVATLTKKEGRSIGKLFKKG
jgi:hypothetical protein